jgi:hypothetical protein
MIEYGMAAALLAANIAAWGNVAWNIARLFQ